MENDNQKIITMFKTLPISQLQNIINANPTNNAYEPEMIEKAKEILESKKTEKDSNYPPVTIKDIQMPFGSMVMFMVKWVIASIPAMIILFLVGFLVMGVFGVGIATLFK